MNHARASALLISGFGLSIAIIGLLVQRCDQKFGVFITGMGVGLFIAGASTISL